MDQIAQNYNQERNEHAEELKAQLQAGKGQESIKITEKNTFFRSNKKGGGDDNI